MDLALTNAKSSGSHCMRGCVGLKVGDCELSGNCVERAADLASIPRFVLCLQLQIAEQVGAPNIRLIRR